MLAMKTDKKNGSIFGYAAIFDQPDLSGDIIRRGAFSSTLILDGASSVKMLYQHAVDKPVGVWERIQEDKHGLYVKGRILLTTQTGLDVWNLITGKAIDGLSIGFKPKKIKSRALGREIISVSLWEISIVTFPMVPRARITGFARAPCDHLKKCADNIINIRNKK